ncbi:hypothetical protein [Halopseudomonas salina]|uniref:Uncharacterized protein n=1 Tax=Halopseudomonas salina TaxID=1323744 RepID=A0ABQ1P2G1_9GAMM|nr:hypothetical protein [Halopseudomonas salina]GGC89329.1 hypothetical protein GCM10007418_06290 [Halopseudomonas salina]
MRLNNLGLYELFLEKGISSLFHANTIATSLTYIAKNGLLSRKYVEEKGLYQTPQESDNIDKKHDVFDDIFLDTVDLHRHFGRQNHYGPSLFRLDLDLLLDEELQVWVTKNNPVYWSGLTDNAQKYFGDVEELALEWDKYERHRKMVTIRRLGRPLSFDYLRDITVDDPRLSIDTNLNLGQESLKAMNEAVQTWGLGRCPVIARECGSCFCSENYARQVGIPELIQKFIPRTF